MIKIAPSMFAGDFADFAGELKKLEAWGADMVHLDVMDGMFVPNMSFGPPVIAAMRKRSELTFDVHLMITQPERYIDDFAAAGADIITVHTEATPHVHRAIQQIKAHGIKAGVVLNPGTPVCMAQHVFSDIDMILLMSVNPGFGGQKFIPSVLEKAREVKALRDAAGYNFDIEIDGGVSESNAGMIRDAGVNVLVAGTTVFRSADPAATIKKLRGQ